MGKCDWQAPEPLELFLPALLARIENAARIDARQQQDHQCAEPVNVLCGIRRQAGTLLRRHKARCALREWRRIALERMRQLQIEKNDRAIRANPDVCRRKIAMNIAGCVKGIQSLRQGSQTCQQLSLFICGQCAERSGLDGAYVYSVDEFESEVAVVACLEVFIGGGDRDATCKRPVHRQLMLQTSTAVASETIRQAVRPAFLEHFRCDMRRVAHIESKKDRARRVRLDHVEQQVARPEQPLLTWLGANDPLPFDEVGKRIDDSARRGKGNGPFVAAPACIILQHREDMTQAVPVALRMKATIACVENTPEPEIRQYFRTLEVLRDRRQLICQRSALDI